MHSDQDKRLWDYRWVRDLGLLSLMGFGLFLLWYFEAILMPVGTALLLAYLSDPLLIYAEKRWKWRRSWTAGGLIAVVSVALLGLMIWLWPLVIGQILTLGTKLPSYLQTTASGFGIDTSTMNLDASSWMKKLENPQQFLGDLFSHSAQAFSVVGIILSVTSSLALNAALIPVYFFFFAWNFPGGVAIAAQFIPVTKRERTAQIMGQMNAAVSGFFRGRLLVSAGMIVLYSMGWFFTDVPYSILLGTLAGLLNIIPYASGLFWPLAIVLKYIDMVSGTGGDPTFMSVVVWPSVVFLVAQFIEGWVLTPWVQSGQLDMSVPTLLIVVFIGGAVGGFMGLLLCIPVAACLKILYKELLHERIVRWVVSH